MIRIILMCIIVAAAACRQERKNDQPPVSKPVVTGAWWKICEMPDLGDLAGPDPERQHIVDHGFIKAENGKWQLWACIRGTAAGRILYRWEGEDLEEGPWTPMGVAARADSTFGEKTTPQETIQAPFFMKIDNIYYCFYTSNGARMMRSDDGTRYQRVNLGNGSNLMYAESGRDIMLLKEEGLFYSYSTISTVARDGWKYGFIILRTSPDLENWSDYTIVSAGGIAGNGPISAESPFVQKLDEWFYLFRSSSVTGKTYVYRSADPYHFGVNEDSKLVETLPVRAPEIIFHEGRYYISDLGDFRGIKLARLEWQP